mgnify:CR=1 FL=1
MTPIAPVLSPEVAPVTCPLCHTADRTVTPAVRAASATAWA